MRVVINLRYDYFGTFFVIVRLTLKVDKYLIIIELLSHFIVINVEFSYFCKLLHHQGVL